MKEYYITDWGLYIKRPTVKWYYSIPIIENKCLIHKRNDSIEGEIHFEAPNDDTAKLIFLMEDDYENLRNNKH